MLSKIKKIKSRSDFLKGNFQNNFILKKGISGPQNFLSDLIYSIEENKLAETTFNFLRSDVHILNSGFHSTIWQSFRLKEREKVILRLDGIGIDMDNNIQHEEIKIKMRRLIDKCSFIIFQSSFCKDCFLNIYGPLPNGKIIKNGAVKFKNISIFSINIQNQINKKFKNKYFVVAGRFIERKRINQIIHQFYESDIGNLVVLSDVPESLKLKNKRIIYLGILDPESARFIIANSIGLIHFDRYDWCPNIVINASFDGIPIICSNYGGTPEIASSNSYILNEFPFDLPKDIEGINFVKRASFPAKAFKALIRELWFKEFIKRPNYAYDIKHTAKSYVDSAKMLLS